MTSLLRRHRIRRRPSPSKHVYADPSFCTPTASPAFGDDGIYPDVRLGDPARSVWLVTGLWSALRLLGLVPGPVCNARLLRRGRAAAARLLAGKAIEQPLMNAAHLVGEQREVGLVGKQP